MKSFYLISTEHLEDALWFLDDEDFVVGMNYVAIEAFLHKGILVVAFVLMSNHVHFILFGEREDVEKFVSDFKGRYAHYYHNKYGTFKLLKSNKVDVEELEFGEGHFERGVAYVLMNCVVANICAHPSQYPWGSGNCYFRPVKPSGRRLGDFSVRDRRKMLHSTEDSLPLEWIVSEKGYILPDNYVGIKAVESRFKSPQRMNYFLNNSSKAKKRLSSEDAIPSFRDQVILHVLPDLIRSLFQKKSFNELTEAEQTECLRQIRYRFSADITQAARVCGISYSEAARLIDKY